MATRLTDRMTINFAGEADCQLAQRFREVVGHRGINRMLRQLVIDFMQRQPPEPPHPS